MFLTKKIGGPVEFGVIMVLIFIIFMAFWYLWYLPAEKKAIMSTYKSSIKIIVAKVEMCMISGGKLNSGFAGSQLCEADSAESYPFIPSSCGSNPFFSVRQLNNKGWKLDTYSDSNMKNYWDCLGCRLSCTSNGCEEIGDCE